MLNFIYYPISAVMRFWREVLTFAGMPHDSGVTWLLAIVLLTATVKAILTYPTVRSIRSSRRMQEITPKIQDYQIPAIDLDRRTDKAAVATVFEKLTSGGCR